MSGGIGTPGLTSVSKRAEELAAAQLQRADLGDRLGAGRPAGGLEVDDDERDLGERRAEVVERCWRGGPAERPESARNRRGGGPDHERPGKWAP